MLTLWFRSLYRAKNVSYGTKLSGLTGALPFIVSHTICLVFIVSDVIVVSHSNVVPLFVYKVLEHLN